MLRLKAKCFIYRFGGTDANVFIEMYGTEGFVGQTALENAANNFERGKTDEFKIQGSDVGDLERIVIRHDNTGFSADWHLQQVRLQYCAVFV